MNQTPERVVKSGGSFRFIGYLLFAGLATWIVMDLTVTRDIIQRVPEVVTDVHEFAGNAELPREVLEDAIQKGQKKMARYFEQGNGFSAAGRVIDWTAFAIGAAIAVLAGYLRQSLPSAIDPADAVKLSQSLAKDNKRFSTIVGTLAALASIATATAGRVEASAKTAYEHGDKVRLAVANFQKEIKESESADAARRVLDDFNAQLLRDE
jgi:hypothetical protein